LPDGIGLAPALQGRMRAVSIVLGGLLTVAPAAAQTPARQPAGQMPAGKTLPLKGSAAANSCAAYGPGFVRVEGTGSCVKIGGALDVGVAASSRR
jgi:hypothetical protein